MTDQRVSDAKAVLWDVTAGTALVLMAAAVSVGTGTVLFRQQRRSGDGRRC